MIQHPAKSPVDIENAPTIRVERGLVLPIVQWPVNGAPRVVDPAGHARNIYRPLLVQSWLLAMIINQAIDPRIRPWVDSLDDHPLSALATATAGRLFCDPGWTIKARKIFAQRIAPQQSNGEFLLRDSPVNPESLWYEQLILLHALASYAVGNPDVSLDAVVSRNAEFHLQQTQPDHATAEPWGLLAFIQYAPLMADQMLHALAMQYPLGATGVPLMLLHEVHYGLRLLLSQN